MHTSKTNPIVAKLKAVGSLRDLEALKDIRYIHMLGSGWHENALKNMSHVNTVVDASLIPMILKLQRADVYIEQAEIFRHQAEEVGILGDLLTLYHPVIDQLGWHLFIGKKSKFISLMPKINEALQHLQASGELDSIKKAIFNSYGIK